MISRFLYLGYHLKNLDKSKVALFIKHVQEEKGKAKWSIWADIIWSSLRYKISILEYFQFGFFRFGSVDRRSWAGTGYMYEYQRKMNPVSARKILDDKRLFYEEYRKFFVHKVYSAETFFNDENIFDQLKDSFSGKCVLKESDGKCGAQVRILKLDTISSHQELKELLIEGGFDMIEEFIVQHHEMMKLSPSAVNTVRIFTQLNKNNEVEILGCRQRISINSSVDNLAAGNVAAPIDPVDHMINGKGVFSDITKEPLAHHPVTGTAIVGFKIPFWSECLQLAKDAALHNTSNRSIGWDIVVTDTGPGLIEGNHDWCKLVWQLPVNKGMKRVLDKHLKELRN